MQIHRLRLTNFRQHESTELELGLGLTGIVGPNGAGKTTILESIAWVLYGMPAARGSRDTIRRRGAPPRSKVEVEMEFALGAHRYRVLRSLGNAELYQDGDPSPIANSIGAVTERVTRLLGMTREEFFNTYFTGQKELAVMAAMTAPERAQFLSRVLGYDKIRVALERLKEKRSALRARLEALRSGLPDPAELDAAEVEAQERTGAARLAEQAAGAELGAAEVRLAEAQPRWAAVQQLRETAGRLEHELQVARVRQRPVRERLEGVRRDAEAAVQAAAELYGLREQLAPRAVLLAERAELDVLAEAVTARRSQAVKLETTRAQLAALDEQLVRLPPPSAVEEARAYVAGVRAELAAASIDAAERRSGWVRDAQDAQTKRQHLLDQYQELKDQRQAILDAGPDGRCPTCARPLGGEFENVVGVLDRQLEEIVSNGNYFKRRLEQLKDEPADLIEAERRQLALAHAESDAVAALARLEAGRGDATRLQAQHERLGRSLADLQAALGSELAGYDQARHTEVRRRVAELEPLQLRAERLTVLAERVDALRSELDARTTELATLDADVARLTQALAELGYSDDAFRELQQQAQQAEAARQAAEVALVRARAELAAATAAVDAVARRRAERAGREREAADTARELALHQELDRALADLRTDLNATLRPDLSALASTFLRDLTNGRYTDLDLDEDYVATLLDDGDPKSVISGGEEDVTNLALRLAISQMIAERAGQPLSLLVLDEIFGSLDEERRASVVELLRSLADRFPQVILITHIDSVRDGFDRVIRVGLDVSRGVATAWDEPLGGAMWRPDRTLRGPFRPTLRDIEPLNRVFAEAFTDRYSRDGLIGVRVPHLNSLVWRYALEDAGDGAMIWRDADGHIVAFNIAHRSGAEGWMGPLAVRPERQGEGVGSAMVRAGIDWLRAEGATTIGLETMPRTVDNIGFYSRLGLVPGPMTVTLVHDAPRRAAAAELLSSSAPGPAACLEECRALADRLLPGVDFTRELSLTRELGIGDTTLIRDGGRLTAFALWHSAPLAAGRPKDELRLLKIAADSLDAFDRLLEAVQGAAVGERVSRLTIRCQTDFPDVYLRLIAAGYRVHWTDLRMYLRDRPQRLPSAGIVMSNWEI